jgi:hypothetical protein
MPSPSPATLKKLRSLVGDRFEHGDMTEDLYRHACACADELHGYEAQLTPPWIATVEDAINYPEKHWPKRTAVDRARLAMFTPSVRKTAREYLEIAISDGMV